MGMLWGGQGGGEEESSYSPPLTFPRVGGCKEGRGTVWEGTEGLTGVVRGWRGSRAPRGFEGSVWGAGVRGGRHGGARPQAD